MAMESCLVGSPTPPIILDERPIVKYHPSLWGDTFTSYESNEKTLCEWKEKAQTLKAEILKVLTEEDEGVLPNKRSKAKLSFIDAIQRLGVSYHFEQEIEKELANVFANYDDKMSEEDDDLHTVALRFRLLREHGYNLTCDVFRKFMDNKSSFLETLCDDLDGLLGLYEATHLRGHGELILENALDFTKTKLRSMLPRLSPSVAKQVDDALYRPLRKRMIRLEARNYLSIYEEDEKHCKALLSFAKLDFNILQKSHQKELSFVSKWWKNLGFETKLPYARDRVVECYFWMLGVYFEPEHAMARIFVSQVGAMISIIDDTYDAYGRKDELELFTEALDRWDISESANLPEYLRFFYQQLLSLFNRAEDELVKQGRSISGVECAKEAMKRLSSAYMKEYMWLHTGKTPTLEEYMKVSLVSCAYEALSAASLALMGDFVNEEAFSWVLSKPKILTAGCVICRLLDDIVSYKFEQEREHPPSAIQCYVEQYGATEEKACQVFRVDIDEAWKDINEAFIRPTPIIVPVLLRVLNLTRMVELFHKDSDGYTHVSPALKDCITSLLITHVEV